MSGALSSLKVLDFTTLLPGPYATMYLGDMGADILRIVSTSRPDLVDFLPPLVPNIKLSAASAQLGRNKRVLALNLKDKRAIKIIHKLISEYDIIIEQFRPGVMAKLKLDYQSLANINPGIIYCSLTGYGQTGSMRNRAGHDINYIARSGVASYSGKKDIGPALSGMQIADVAAGSNNAIIGILAAVVFRQSSGKGQHIDISMTDGMIAYNSMYGAGFLVDNKDPVYEDNLLNGGSIYDYYKTKDRKYLSVGSIEPQFFSNFCDVINRPDLKQEGIFPKNITQIKKEISEIFLTKTRDEWMTVFNQTDACVEPVMTLSEVFADKMIVERKMVVDVPMSNGKKVRQIANPIKFSKTPQEYKYAGVFSKTEHTKEVLKEIGYKEKEIDEFKKTGLFS
ncbi:MAG: CoA transferase [Epsilonproteobacteria bacterium]|nr:CoA transferase [Campylobacterota bacterium]